MLVVIEDDEVVRRDPAVAGEDETDIDRTLLQGGKGQRSARVERLERLELQAVRLLEAGLAERSLRALRWPAQSPLAGDRRGDVRELGEVVLVGLGLGDREGILIDGGRGIQRLDTLAGQTSVDLLHVGGRVGAGLRGSALTLVDEGQ